MGGNRELGVLRREAIYLWYYFSIQFRQIVTAGMQIRAFYKDRKFFNFSGFEEPRSHDTDSNIFLRFLKIFVLYLLIYCSVCVSDRYHGKYVDFCCLMRG